MSLVVNRNKLISVLLAFFQVISFMVQSLSLFFHGMVRIHTLAGIHALYAYM